MTERRTADVAVIGAGMAGISAGLWCRRYGLSCIIHEKENEPGGQIHLISGSIPDFAGYAGSAQGLISVLKRQIDEQSLDVRYGEPALEVDAGRKILYTSHGETSYRELIVSTGLRRRLLKEAEGLSGIYYSVGKNMDALKNKKVCICGSGDGAYEAAATLAENGSDAFILIRGAEAKARPELRKKAEAAGARMLFKQEIESVSSEKGSLRIRTGPDSPQLFEAEALVVKIGFEPSVDFLPSELERDSAGYPVCSDGARSSVSGIWICGDCAGPYLSSLVSSACSASAAVKRIMEDFSSDRTPH